MVTKEDWVRIIKDWHESEFPEFVDRDFEIPIETKLQRAISLIGPRRVGKTYELFIIAKKISDKYGKDKTFYINFEKPILSGIDSKEIDKIIEAYFSMFPENKKQNFWLFLDEIQNVKNWELFVRSCLDQGIRVFISGSSSKLLSKEIATSMRGRNLSYKIYPFSFKEYLNTMNFQIQKFYSSKEKSEIEKYFDDYLNWGGYPETVISPENKEKLLLEIFNTTILNDIIERNKIRNTPILKLMIKALLTSKEFSVNKFYNYLKSQGIKIGKNSLYFNLDYLEDAFFIFALRKFNLSYKKSDLTLPKIYFIDNGLLRVNSIDDKGRFLENLVFIELKRRGKDITYYQNSAKEELDFIVKEGKKVKQLIQVCYSLENFITKEREIKPLLEASSKFKCNDLLILTNSEEKEEIVKGKKIRFIPVWRWLLI